MTTLDEMRNQWISERPMYVDFVGHIESMLRQSLQSLGVRCEISGRAKDISSFLTKVLRKNYSSYSEVVDKAGVRIVIWYDECLNTVDEAVRTGFDVKDFDDKASKLAPDQFGYSGKHYQVEIPAGTKCDARFHGLSCEIQVHTRAQNLWSDVTHDLTYKPAAPIPPEIQRPVNRLVALVELFDDQLRSVQQRLRTLPDFRESSMLYELEKCFYRLVARNYDRELSLQVLNALVPLYSSPELDRFSTLLGSFVADNSDKLGEIYASYSDDDRCNPLLFQPESIAIFERLAANPFTLHDAWSKKFPVELLCELGTIWGVNVAAGD